MEPDYSNIMRMDANEVLKLTKASSDTNSRKNEPSHMNRETDYFAAIYWAIPKLYAP